MTRGKLEIKVLNAPTFLDINGRYVAYCTFYRHSGIIRNKNKCEERKCSHYRKLYMHRASKI